MSGSNSFDRLPPIDQEEFLLILKTHKVDPSDFVVTFDDVQSTIPNMPPERRIYVEQLSNGRKMQFDEATNWVFHFDQRLKFFGVD